MSDISCRTWSYPGARWWKFDFHRRVDYIEMLYNPVRRHGFADDLSPIEFERRYVPNGS